MKRFKDKNLTDAEWREVFDYPKKFDIGDIVECGQGYHSVRHIWRVDALSPCKKGDDLIYQLKNIVTGKLEFFSSTFIQPLGTFIDDEILTRGVTN